MKPENLKCPICDATMISRLNKRENKRFWGCSNFPKCKGTRDVDGLSNEERRLNKEQRISPSDKEFELDDEDDNSIRRRWNRS